MATTALYPSANDGGWDANENYAYADDGNYATEAPATNSTSNVEYGNFGFDATIPAGATINSVTIEVQWKVSTTASSATLRVDALVSSSAVGTQYSNATEPTSDTTSSYANDYASWTRDALLDGVFEVRLGAQRGAGATGYTMSVDYVKVTVDYTAAAAPTVTTSDCSSIATTSATGNGNITATGGSTVTRRGFCYKTGTSGDPTTSDSVAYDDGTFSTGAYTKSIASLSAGTAYRVRAYAVNTTGTGYGTTVQLYTLCAAPTSVAATDGTYTDKVTITWTKSTGATGYKVYEGTNLLDTLGDVATYDDTAAPAPTITAGTASASDGTSTSYVTLSISGEGTSNGASRTYKVKAVNLSGDSADSSTDTGYRGVGTLGYQWQRSAADSDASYSNISGGTTDPYNDTGAPADGSGRYFKCVLAATGASGQTTNADRGYRIANTAPTVALNSPVMTEDVNTYYFDGSDAAASDPTNSWDDETNADDGSLLTFAYSDVDDSSYGDYFIKLEGTNATGTDVVSQVRVRGYGWLDDMGNVSIRVYTNGLGELLGTATIGLGAAGWGDYATLSEPSGGWDFDTIAALECKIWQENSGYNYGRIYKVEIEVTTLITGSTSDTTPELVFTGTDANSDDIRYNLQLDTVNTFDSQAGEGTYENVGVGEAAQNYGGGWDQNYTILSKNVADVDCTISKIEVYFDGDVTGVYVGTFYGSGTSYQVRDYEYLGDASGGLSTYTGLSITCNAGDLIGIYITDIDTGGISTATSGGSGEFYVSGNKFLTGATTYTSWSVVDKLAIQAYYLGGIPLIDDTSNVETTYFTRTGDTDPFTSGEAVTYTVQAGDTLDPDTYYWRVRGLDPSGTNTYGDWSSTYSFTVSAAEASVLTGNYVYMIVSNA